MPEFLALYHKLHNHWEFGWIWMWRRRRGVLLSVLTHDHQLLDQRELGSGRRRGVLRQQCFADHHKLHDHGELGLHERRRGGLR
jgi:hypothetical protein